MKNHDQVQRTHARSRTAERLIAWIMVLFFVGFAWRILITGGVSISGKKGVSYLTGDGALAMVGISLFVASLSSVLLIKVMGFGRKRAAVLLALVWLPVAVFLLLKKP
ncbi:MAG: hypothetical protein RL761_1264 [Pseudomonadota bacterium]|jgi:hypothetical protein